MLDLYGVRSPQREALIQLGRDARRRGWWTACGDVFTGSYIAMESEAASIRINAHVVPGIFQTPGYAREVIARTRPASAPKTPNGGWRPASPARTPYSAGRPAGDPRDPG